jgi:Fe-S-cluster containining protein
MEGQIIKDTVCAACDDIAPRLFEDKIVVGPHVNGIDGAAERSPRRNSNFVELDGKNRKLVMLGSCLELLPLCAAACCREWREGISFEEYRSGLYQAEQMCALTDKACDLPVAVCVHRTYQLKKNADNACFHLDELNHQYQIYENRPKTCRDFSCQGGWRLASVFPIAEVAQTASPELKRETFVECLTEDEIFITHPLIKLHAVICLPARREIIFIKQMVGACGKFNGRDNFPYPQLNDELVLALIHSFNNQDSLKEIHQRFYAQHALSITTSEFTDIVWLLNKHNLILSVKNFRGMLAGMGGIEY